MDADHATVKFQSPVRAAPEQGEAGQSVLEFLIMLPVILVLAVLMIKVNSAIQVAIVNQQYARAQALWLTFNNPVFPFVRLETKGLNDAGYNQMVLGVANNPAPESGAYEPEAAIVEISRKRGAGSDEPQREDVTQRSRVRIRNTVTLCTHQAVVLGGTGTVPLVPRQSSARWDPTGPGNMNEGTRFAFCRQPPWLTYE